MTSAPSLMEHQREGIAFLTASSGGLLAFEQGLGKTRVAIESFKSVRVAGTATRLLVICPNSLKRNWVAELGKFAPELDAKIVEGSQRQRRHLFSAALPDVVIVSYETARADITSILALIQRQPTALVLDESHATKNWRSLTSTATRHFAPHCAYRWLLSGTPVTNTPEDLYTQVELIAPGERLLGSREAFLATVETNPDSLRAAIDSVVLRRTKEQCLDLPDKTFVDVRVDLPAWQRKLYDDMRSEMVCAIQAMTGEEYRAFASTALAQLTRLMQLASNPKLLMPQSDQTPGKFEVLDGCVTDILADPSRKLIVWSSYVATIDALVERYADYGAVALYGGVPADTRQTIAERFQTDPSTRVLVANPAAAGTGFTLTAATYSIYETLAWRYDFYAQSQDRNHRIGQQRPVTYVRLLAADTIEEAIVKALERKASMARDLLGDGETSPVLAKLSANEMCNLLMTNELPSLD